MVEVGSTSMRGSVARSQTLRSHDSVNAGSNSVPDSNECSENAIYQTLSDLGLLKEEEDRKKHSSSTSLKLPAELPSIEETLKTADVRGNELNAKAENQRKGSFFQGVTCITNSKSDICQKSDIGPTIRSHFPSNDPQPCPRCSSIRALMKAAIAEKMRFSSIMEARA